MGPPPAARGPRNPTVVPRLLLGVSALGLPLTVIAIRKLGRPGQGRPEAVLVRERPTDGTASPPQEIAAGVYWLPLRGSNVYFVRSGSGWVLVDTAWANCASPIQQVAEALFGAEARPDAILLTHDHPDHAGSARELAIRWGCPVYVHPDELALATAHDLSTIERYANPLDRWIVLPLLRVLGSRRAESIIANSSLAGVARAFDPGAAVPGLADWACVPTPGHAPGHVALFRATDRVLITGDAILTIDLSSLRGLLSWALRANSPRVAFPPWFTNWNQQATKASIVALARLEPRVLASGHGIPMTGANAARELHSLAETLPALLAGHPRHDQRRSQGNEYPVPTGSAEVSPPHRPYVRPDPIMRWLINPLMARLGIGTTLIVRGRRTGRIIATPLGAPLVVDGERYLVSGGGNTHWVRNLRAAGQAALRANGCVEEFRAVELAGAERERIVTAYRQQLGHRGDRYFAQLPDAADHAVFRVEPLGPAVVTR